MAIPSLTYLLIFLSELLYIITNVAEEMLIEDADFYWVGRMTHYVMLCKNIFLIYLFKDI